MKNPTRFLNSMMAAYRALEAVRKTGSEEGFKFFLTLVGLQSEVMAPKMASAPKPGTILTAPSTTPAKLALPATAPARIPQGRVPEHKPVHRPTPPPSNDFAGKLNGAAKELGFEDKSSRGQFIRFLADKGKKDWNLGREMAVVVVGGGFLKPADWPVLAEVLKKHLFFNNGPAADRLLADCPEEILADLVLGLNGLLSEIKTEKGRNYTSVYHAAFILRLCERVGEKADGVLAHCRQAIKSLKDRGLVNVNDWLYRRAFPRTTAIPIRKYAAPAGLRTEAPPAPAPDQELEQAPQVAEDATVAEAAPAPVVGESVLDSDNMTEEELEKHTAPEVPVNGVGKPASLDAGFTAAFEQQMLAPEGELEMAHIA